MGIQYNLLQSGQNYFGIVLNHELKWDLWADLKSTKTQQIMYFLKKLLSYNVNSKMFQKDCQKNCSNGQQTARDYVIKYGMHLQRQNDEESKQQCR